MFPRLPARPSHNPQLPLPLNRPPMQSINRKHNHRKRRESHAPGNDKGCRSGLSELPSRAPRSLRVISMPRVMEMVIAPSAASSAELLDIRVAQHVAVVEGPVTGEAGQGVEDDVLGRVHDEWFFGERALACGWPAREYAAEAGKCGLVILERRDRCWAPGTWCRCHHGEVWVTLYTY